jgi:arginyl-tRNA--protein-N-Asp/Glu arginylyltransferase
MSEELDREDVEEMKSIINEFSAEVKKISLVQEQYQLYRDYTMSASTIHITDTPLAIELTEKALTALKLANSRNNEFFGESITSG